MTILENTPPRRSTRLSNRLIGLGLVVVALLAYGLIAVRVKLGFL